MSLHGTVNYPRWLLSQQLAENMLNRVSPPIGVCLFAFGILKVVKEHHGASARDVAVSGMF